MDSQNINFLTVSQSFEDRLDLSNGVNLLPEEMITKILDYIEPYELLKLSGVCQKWNVIIKQPYLWRKKYQRKYNEKPKNHQWFVLFSMITTDYYDIKPIRRGDAHNRFKKWADNTKTANTSHLISPVEGYHVTTIEGRVPLNLRAITRCTSRTNISINIPEIINYGNNRLVKSIVDAFKPIVYTVEWLKFSIVTYSCNHHKMSKIMNNGTLAEYCSKQGTESAIIRKLASRCKEKPIMIKDYALLDNISYVHVISINQPLEESPDDDNSIDVMERQPKIYACSLPC